MHRYSILVANLEGRLVYGIVNIERLYVINSPSHTGTLVEDGMDKMLRFARSRGAVRRRQVAIGLCQSTQSHIYATRIITSTDAVG